MFLSIIVPIYNAEQYLDECLESLLKQNIPSDEYEIICVNDGSTDNTSVILKNYEKRVHIINGFNSGVSRARNKGLEISGGYIWFVDADDFIQTDVLRDLKEKAEKEKPDQIEFGCYTFYGELSISEKQNYLKRELSTNSYYGDSVVWTSIFKKSFLKRNNLSFISVS